jgi:hypothetical protein
MAVGYARLFLIVFFSRIAHDKRLGRFYRYLFITNGLPSMTIYLTICHYFTAPLFSPIR